MNHELNWQDLIYEMIISYVNYPFISKKLKLAADVIEGFTYSLV